MFWVHSKNVNYAVFIGLEMKDAVYFNKEHALLYFVFVILFLNHLK